MAKKQGSEPKYGIKTEKDVFVTMRDGVRVAVNIYRPDAEGKFPALLAMSAYGKECEDLLLPPQPVDKSPLWDGNIEAGDPQYFVPRGYVHIIGDVRGSGDSEGEFVGICSKKEGEDGYDLVEWIAQQPWCDGNVGMVGYSYFGEIQLFVAGEQPPHLKTIVPTGIWTDLYRGMAYHGGVLCLFLYGLWDGRLGTSGLAPKNVVSAMMKELPKEEFDRRRQELLNNQDINHFPNLYHLLKYPYKNPVFVDLLLNPYDGPFYWERSAYTYFDKIKIPFFTIAPGRPQAHFDAYTGIDAPKKMLLHPPMISPPRPWREEMETLVRWYDHWLKGIDTGIMDEPPIKLFVTGSNKWRYENEWPLPGMKPTKFYLASWQSLSQKPEAYMDEPDCFVQHPLHVSAERQSLKYLTPPLLEDLEVIGPVALHLYASIDAEDTNWIVDFFDIDEHGAERRLSQGYFKASHRALDKEKSTPSQPYHPHDKTEPVVPGEICEYAIALETIAHVFKAGHQLKLDIRSMESPHDDEFLVHYHPHLCSSQTTLHKIYRNKEYQSHLLLPVIDES
ncbi:CocE/NonD family hydrolase [Chloroflexota bacterium]